MKAARNGTPKQCVENLLSMVRGENPMERVKGIDARWFDRPEGQAAEGLVEDANWLIRTYEPRVNVEDVKISIAEQQDGSYGLTAFLSDV